jgi:hypothetical protein
MTARAIARAAAVDCEGCAEERKRLERGQEEVAKLAEMTGANESEQITERLRYLVKLSREGLDEEEVERKN